MHLHFLRLISCFWCVDGHQTTWLPEEDVLLMKSKRVKLCLLHRRVQLEWLPRGRKTWRKMWKKMNCLIQTSPNSFRWLWVKALQGSLNLKLYPQKRGRERKEKLSEGSPVITKTRSTHRKHKDTLVSFKCSFVFDCKPCSCYFFIPFLPKLREGDEDFFEKRLNFLLQRRQDWMMRKRGAKVKCAYF